MSQDNLVAFIMLLCVFIFGIVISIYRYRKLEFGKTQIVTAKIVSIKRGISSGIRWTTYPSIGCEYDLLGKKCIDYFNASRFIDKVRIGGCVEIKVSLENTDFSELNYDRGVFRCEK